VRYTDEERREILARARATLARVDRTLALEKLPERGRPREHERRHQTPLIYKTKYNARIF
jgi:hypothetical protein